jgi:hypothetical protein
LHTSICGADFPPAVVQALSQHVCENFTQFNQINETDENPFQYGYENPENVIVWCRWKSEAHLLIVSPQNEANVFACPNQIKSKYISAGGLSLQNKTIELSQFSKISDNQPLATEAKTENILIHSDWAGAGTYLYCYKGEWVYFNHD